MEHTPKLVRKTSLSLGRLKQNRLETLSSRSTSEETISTPKCRSPSKFLRNPDGIGVDCTPPQRIRNLDDSIEYTPNLFDRSFSPSGVCSQTIPLDSPEVGWRWAQKSTNRLSRDGSDSTVTTPDSAYSADSSFKSSTSCNTDVSANKRSFRTRLSYERRREEQLKKLEVELRRAEKARAEQQLNERCAKLKEQLRNEKLETKHDKENDSKTNTRNKNILVDITKTINPDLDIHQNISNNKNHNNNNKNNNNNNSENKSNSKNNCNNNDGAIVHNKNAKNDLEFGDDALVDFLNDFDADCLLLEVTQKVESKINSSIQKCITPPQTPKENKTLAINTSISGNKDKRSSFYMKFLEDDFSDDWFLSLDEAVLEATQSKKPRISLQRYKSMPVDTTSVTCTEQTKTTSNITDCTTTNRPTTTVPPIMADSLHFSNKTDDSPRGGISKMKRHSSSHTLSPASTSYRGRQLRLRK